MLSQGTDGEMRTLCVVSESVPCTAVIGKQSGISSACQTQTHSTAQEFHSCVYTPQELKTCIQRRTHMHIDDLRSSGE